MYLAFFGFKEKPFNLTPDPKFLYLNASYREALAALHYGVGDRKGFVSLIGEAGTGKTTLLRRLLSELPRETRSVLVINPAIGFEEMLRFILSDLGKPQPSTATKLDMLEALNAELLDTLARGGNVVVLIDESQDLTIPVLEELRLLSNLETAKEKILQLVLAGQPEFDALLARREIRQLRQRISVRARLRALARSEVQAYVAARIAAAGGDVRGLFTKPALFRLWQFSGGVPRLINAACDNALVTAYAAGRRTIGWRDIGEAMRDLRRHVPWVPKRFAFRAGTLLGAAAVGAAIVGGMWLLRERQDVPFSVAANSQPPPVAGDLPVPAIPPVPPVAAAPSPGAAPATRELAAADPAPAPPTGENPAADPPSHPGVAVIAPVVAEPSPVASPAAPDHVALGATDRDATAERRTTDVQVRVTSGDNLTEIARRYYGSAGPRVLEAIKDANPWMRDPDVLWVGKVVVLPGAQGLPHVAGDDAPLR